MSRALKRSPCLSGVEEVRDHRLSIMHVTFKRGPRLRLTVELSRFKFTRRRPEETDTQSRVEKYAISSAVVARAEARLAT